MGKVYDGDRQWRRKDENKVFPYCKQYLSACLFNLSVAIETEAWVIINLPKVKQQILNQQDSNHAKASACSL